MGIVDFRGGLNRGLKITIMAKKLLQRFLRQRKTFLIERLLIAQIHGLQQSRVGELLRPSETNYTKIVRRLQKKIQPEAGNFGNNADLNLGKLLYEGSDAGLHLGLRVWLARLLLHQRAQRLDIA